jgi:DNA-binding GntR family transcriptional regulator
VIENDHNSRSPGLCSKLDAFRDLKTWGGECDLIEYNRTFHITLTKPSPNQRIATAAQDLIEQFNQLVIISEHQTIIDAQQAREGGRVARPIGKHTVRARKRLMKSLLQSASCRN